MIFTGINKTKVYLFTFIYFTYFTGSSFDTHTLDKRSEKAYDCISLFSVHHSSGFVATRPVVEQLYVQ
jgi:hypothetical protein